MCLTHDASRSMLQHGDSGSAILTPPLDVLSDPTQFQWLTAVFHGFNTLDLVPATAGPSGAYIAATAYGSSVTDPTVHSFIDGTAGIASYVAARSSVIPQEMPG